MGTYSKNNFCYIAKSGVVYDAVANFNIGMKASLLIYEKLNFVPGVHMLRGCNKYNIKRVNLANQRITPKNKLRRQVLRAEKMTKNDKLIEKEGDLYIPGGFYISFSRFCFLL